MKRHFLAVLGFAIALDAMQLHQNLITGTNEKALNKEVMTALQSAQRINAVSLALNYD